MATDAVTPSPSAPAASVPTGPTISVTLGAFTLPAFSVPLEIEIFGQTVTVQAPVPAGIQIPPGVIGTFVMPQATVSFTADSAITVDSANPV